MNFEEYPISELQDLLQAIEDQCMASADKAIRLEKWYQRVKEALNNAYNEAEEEYNNSNYEENY